MKVVLIVAGAGVALLGVGYGCYQKGRADQMRHDRETVARTDETLRSAVSLVDEAMDLIAEASGVQRRHFISMPPPN